MPRKNTFGGLGDMPHPTPSHVKVPPIRVTRRPAPKPVMLIEQDEWRRINRVLMKANQIMEKTAEGVYKTRQGELFIDVAGLCIDVEHWVSQKDESPEAPRDD